MRFEPRITGGPAPLLDQLQGLIVVERIEVAPRGARFTSAPVGFAEGRLGAWLKSSVGGLDRIFLHQGIGMAAIVQDLNVVVATATASGKSLIFMAAAIRKLLSGKGRVLVFYPQKSLGSDQRQRWEQELTHAGCPRSWVGEITGDTPIAEREAVLASARIILATPDVIHCWLMPALGSPVVAAFIRTLELLILDEAHALEAVFGSHAALFIRRLRDAKRRLVTNTGPEAAAKDEFQIVAATATLGDPQAHLRALTGLDFVVVDEKDNGAPSHGLTVLHVEGPDVGAPAEQMCAELVERLSSCMPAKTALIAFADSRQGVERIIRRVGKSDVLPYRSGYSREDRRAIETELRNGKLAGVIATSALELGIDLPQFALGLTLGVPSSRKSLRQRIGRIGRAQRGVFVVIAPRTAFAKLGSSLREYVTGPVEHTPLYPDNPFIQFQHARCLLEETGGLEAPKLDARIDWPQGFGESLSYAEIGAPRPRFLDDTAALGCERPHLAYSLRSMPGDSFILRHAVSGEHIGYIDHEKALRETYPGATYFHFRQPYRVEMWRYLGFAHEIELRPVRHAEPTQPILRCQVAIALGEEDLIEHHHLASESGSLAETQIHVTESVEGLRYGQASVLYKDLAQKDRRLTRKSRRYPTSGIMIRISEPWFSGDGEQQMAMRRAVGEAFEAMLVSAYGISPRDLRSAHTGLSLRGPDGAKRIDDAVVIFDSVIGGLRLSAPLFVDFAAILDRLARAAELAGSEALISANTVERLRRWHEGLSAADQAESNLPKVGNDELLIFAPESIVSVRARGSIEERRLIEPALIPVGAGEQLMYRYEAAPGVNAWVAHDQIEAFGDQWRMATWNPATGTIQLKRENV